MRCSSVACLVIADVERQVAHENGVGRHRARPHSRRCVAGTSPQEAAAALANFASILTFRPELRQVSSLSRSTLRRAGPTPCPNSAPRGLGLALHGSYLRSCAPPAAADRWGTARGGRRPDDGGAGRAAGRRRRRGHGACAVCRARVGPCARDRRRWCRNARCPAGDADGAHRRHRPAAGHPLHCGASTAAKQQAFGVCSLRASAADACASLFGPAAVRTQDKTAQFVARNGPEFEKR